MKALFEGGDPTFGKTKNSVNEVNVEVQAPVVFDKFCREQICLKKQNTVDPIGGKYVLLQQIFKGSL